MSDNYSYRHLREMSKLLTTIVTGILLTTWGEKGYSKVGLLINPLQLMKYRIYRFWYNIHLLVISDNFFFSLIACTIFLNTNKIIKGFSIMAYWHRPQKFTFVKSWSILSDLFRSSFTAVTQPAIHVRWGTNQNICWIAKETLFSPKQCAPSTGHKKPEKRQFLLQRHR